MSQSLISVIVPVYNVKEYLNTCVESILNQTHENLEVILVDDGSTDGSGEICDSYAKTDTRVQVLHTTNGGQAAARNRGIEVCKGEYLTFIDSDDSMEPELIETLYLAQKKSGANLVSCRWRNVYEDGRIERSSGQTSGSVNVGKEEALRRMLYQIDTDVCVWAKLYQRDLFKSLRFEEGKILKEIVQETGKSMLENVDKYKYLQEDYKEYIELWIHEIKLPIAAGKMIIENNKSEVTESINEELDKIENYIEQALFYARSNTVEKDYYIKKVNLKEIVNSSIIKNKRNLIQNKINIDAHDINTIVYTDHKWCMFILSQIIQNAVKYSKEDSKKIEIYSEIKKENTILYIKDNGIGIRKGEITRVFEKGFTGENGRKRGQKATGIGLYLCKKLCNKLGLGLELNSEKDVGTEVKIVFPKSSFISETF
jgi:glycosyltransferase involved in cell wall biosynthesis